VRIIVYEYISSGGLAGQPIPPNVLSEGFGMLRTVASDFKAAGHEVSVLLDDRLSKLNPPINAGSIVPIFYSQEPKKFLSNIAKISDAIYIIAPETGKTLQSYVELAEQTGKISLNCKSSSIQKVADKTILTDVLKKNALPTPKTLVLNVNDSLTNLKRAIKNKLSYPVLFKPVNCVACGGLSVAKEEGLVDEAIAKIKVESADEQAIIQEFIEGDAASVSLLCTKDKALAISLNQQTVKVGAPADVSSYEGGIVPFDHSIKQEAYSTAEKVVKCFPGLSGYVGVDLVLANDGQPFVIDVNPRLTTSYVGLSRVAEFNVAQALVNSVLKNRLPPENENSGYVCFSKLVTPKATIETFQKVAHMSEVVSPPFPINDNSKACALITGQNDSLKDAKLQLEEAKQRVLTLISRGK
jgi:predicted ATP-grasp superfamily ATP-dependent carboligase